MFVIDLKDMETNWTVLKKKLDEQLEDIKKHSGPSGNWGVCRKEDQLKAWNGGWHTEEEIEEILKN